MGPLPKVSDRPRFVANVAALANVTGKRDGDLAQTGGYTTLGDGGGNTYYWDDGSSTTADGGFVITATGGRWKALDQTVADAKQWGCALDGATDDSARLTAMAASGAERIEVNGGTMLLEGDVTLGDATTLGVKPGASIQVDSANTLTINGGIDAGNYAIFDADSGDVLIRHSSSEDYLDTGIMDSTNASHRVPKINALWFTGDDIGEKANKALNAGGEGACVTIPSGFYTLSTTIDMDQHAHMVLEGQGQIGTTLVIPSITGGIVGISLVGANDECTVRNLRVTEATGSIKSVCIQVGGTTSMVDGCWFGNAFRGIFINSGAGHRIINTVVESCTCNVMIASRAGFGNVLDNGSAINDLRISDCMITGGGDDNENVGGRSVWVEAMTRVALTGPSSGGFFDRGDTVTGGTSGATARVLDYNSSSYILTLYDVTGTFQTSETISANTESGTISAINSNAITGVSMVNCMTKLGGDDCGIYVGNGVDGFRYSGLVREITGNDVKVEKAARPYFSASFNASDNTTIVAEDSEVFLSGCEFSPTSDIAVIDSDNSHIRASACSFKGLTNPFTVSNGGSLEVEACDVDAYCYTVTAASPTLAAGGTVAIDSGSNAVNATLTDGTRVGQRVTIVMTDASNASTVTVTSHKDGDGKSIPFTAVGQQAILEWSESGWVTLSGDPARFVSAYASGTAYTLTDSSAALDFSVNDPQVTIPSAGTWRITGRAKLRYTAATVSTETATIKLRRTNNTAADLSGASATVDLPAKTTTTEDFGFVEVEAIYTTANDDDTVALFGNVSATFGAGSMTVNVANVVATRVDN